MDSNLDLMFSLVSYLNRNFQNKILIKKTSKISFCACHKKPGLDVCVDEVRQKCLIVILS
jgi:hypothetical protein